MTDTEILHHLKAAGFKSPQILQVLNRDTFPNPSCIAWVRGVHNHGTEKNFIVHIGTSHGEPFTRVWDSVYLGEYSPA